MIHQIDIIALHVVAMCEELISSLASEGCVNGIRNTAIKCLNTNKRKIGLKSFYLYAERKWSESFIACLNFENYDEDIKIRFKLSNSYKCIFTASVIGPTRVISKPIVQKHSQLDINKFVYCNPHHNILYIDNLVEEMTDGYEFFSLSDITNWRNDINNSKKEVLLTFADGIKDEERRMLKIANYSRWDFIDNENKKYRELLSNIERWYISCVVIRDLGIAKRLNRMLPCCCQSIEPNGILPQFTKREWVRRVLLTLHSQYGELSPWNFQHYSFSRDLYHSIKQFERDFSISDDIMDDVSIDIIRELELGGS